MMNERGHVINAVLLSVGIAVILEGRLAVPPWQALLAVGVPVTLGALFPDIDTSFGTHRKTFHNLATLGAFVAFPVVFYNLQFVWIGVATHYVLDMLGNVRGMALFYPWSREFDVPVGVSVSSRWAGPVTLAVTAFELAVVAAVVHTEAYAPVLEAVAPFV